MRAGREASAGPEGKARDERRAAGVYYTPQPIVDYVVRHMLGPLLRARAPEQLTRLRILDLACGNGAFLLGAFRFLCDHAGATPALRRRIVSENLYGVDLDPAAVKAARRSLLLAAGADLATQRRIDRNVRVANALLGPDCPAKTTGTSIDWSTEFPGGFDVVLGNPPWGQKGVRENRAVKEYLWRRFPTSTGIFDLFRPFVELGVRLTRPGGRFGMVLPDIVLLKDYAATRRHLLDTLTLERIDWWGKAFADAEIDVATILGRKETAAADHTVAVAVHDPEAPLAHAIPQADFRANPRYVFNLFLTSAKRQVLEKLRSYPQLGDWFEVHEGIHSGNLRKELFVAKCVDASCRPLLFGRAEIAPYRLAWQGKHVRLAALPEKRSRLRYANLGQAAWHERDKLLVRRTGDFVLAAVDRERRFVTNNFFLVFPKKECALDLDGLCALLNSRLMTWYFRAIEPRQGRVFAELKIKHLRTFPVPVLKPDSCRALNELGARRIGDSGLDRQIDALVYRLFGVKAADLGLE